MDFNLSSSSCPYAESQPGQLLALIKCSDPDDPTGESLNASTTTVFKEEVIQIGTRTMLVPSTEADIVLQRDHNSPSHFYLLLEHVNFVLPESYQEVAPTYEAYVQCSNGVSTATLAQPVTFCIKHSRLTARFTGYSSLTYTPATLYFTNIPRKFHVLANPTAGQLLFNVRVGVWNAIVPSYTFSTNDQVFLFFEEEYILRVWDAKCQTYSASGESPIEIVATNNIGTGEYTHPMSLLAWLAISIDTLQVQSSPKF